MAIYLRLRELRQARGWSQGELSRRSGVRKATISTIETDKAKGISFAILEALADALGVDPALLIVRD